MFPNAGSFKNHASDNHPGISALPFSLPTHSLLGQALNHLSSSQLLICIESLLSELLSAYVPCSDLVSIL